MMLPDPVSDEGTAYQACLDAIFVDFLGKRERRAGRHDRESRDPSLILDLARQLDLLPDRRRVIRVTGSKGKGTTARLAAAWLQRQPVGPVGLFVSPNELDQEDRIRLDGVPLPRADLVRLYGGLRPHLAALPVGGRHYLSPFGIFLLIALAWFKERKAGALVLEAGRGAAFDEVGRLPARVGVLTALFPDHADQIGPTLADIARNKLAIADGATVTVLGPGVPDRLASLGLGTPPGAAVVTDGESDDGLPRWVARDRAIAETAGRALLAGLGQAIRPAPSPPVVTASFGTLSIPGPGGPRRWIYDGTIALDSLDRAWFAGLRAAHPRLLALVCLSDQKSHAPLIDWLRAQGVVVAVVVLEGLDLHRFDAVRQRYAGLLTAPVGFTDADGVLAVADCLIVEHRPDAVLALGLQPFLRLLKQGARRRGVPLGPAPLAGGG